MIKYQIKTLSNGLKIIIAPMLDTKAVTVLFFVGVGSRFETKLQNGLSHFLEHMVFKGSQKRPTHLAISTELDSIGAQYNAFTGEEGTGYYVRASADRFPLAFDIVSDMVTKPVLPEPELEREKGVIIEEINMYRDNPPAHVADLIKKVTYGDSPLGWSIAGRVETVSGFSQPDFKRYHEQFYTPNNMVVVVAGNPLKHDWYDLIAKTLKGISKGSESVYQPFGPLQAKPQLRVEHRETDQAHFILAVPKFRRVDPRWPVMRVIVNLLGGMMSSRLFVEVREKRGLAYYINASAEDYHDTGLVYIRAGVDIKKIDEALRVVLAEMGRIKSAPVPEQELIKAKENLKGNLYLGLEDTLSVAEFLADQAMFWGSIDQPEQIVEDIMKVTSDDIMKVAKELFVQEKLNLAVLGPYQAEDKFRSILKL